MSQDTLYQHQLWHIEDPTLTVSQARLKLLFDFDAPSQYRLQPSCPLTHGLRPSCVLCGTVTSPGGQGPHTAAASASASAPLTARRMSAFGRVGHVPVQYQEPLVSEWSDIGIPPILTKEGA